MLQSWIDKLNDLSFPVLQLTIGFLVGFFLAWITSFILSRANRRSRFDDLKYFEKRTHGSLRTLLPIISIFIALSYAEESEWAADFMAIFRVLLIVASAYFLITCTYALEDIFRDRYDIGKEDNHKERKIITQLNFIKRVVIIGIVLIALSVLLLSFEEGRKYGTTLLTSAGVASIIIGLAAQKSLANFFAGIQIAFTQPIRIDDAVVVEGEWGWIEEINLTYVVVRIWDWRRLILPITYFVEKPFQNWTRTKGEIIGTVFFKLDYTAPIQKIREKLEEIVKEEPYWDGQVVNLQVSDTEEYTIQVRALVSAKNSPQAWDLRCSVREKLISFLQEEYPECLPTQRLAIKKNSQHLPEN